MSVNGAIVYAAFKGFFFVERSDRSFGMKIRSQTLVSVGDVVDVSGQIYSENILLPAVDDFIAVNRSSDKEVVGSLTIRTIWRTPNSGSSLTQSSSGTGTISGTLTAQGTDSQTARVAVVNSNAASQDFNFTLAKSEMIVHLVIDSRQVLADGTKEVVVKAIVRDVKGRRPSNQPISWLLGGETTINADSMTDAVGEAVVVFRSPSEVVSEVAV